MKFEKRDRYLLWVVAGLISLVVANQIDARFHDDFSGSFLAAILNLGGLLLFFAGLWNFFHTKKSDGDSNKTISPKIDGLKKRWFSKKWVVFPALLLVVVIASTLVSFFGYKPGLKNQIPKCSYEFTYGNVRPVAYGHGSEVIEDFYDGAVKNVSLRTEYLKAVLVKIYDSNNILLAQGYKKIEQNIEPNTGLRYSVGVQFPNVRTRNEVFILGTEVDIYPWFTTCK